MKKANIRPLRNDDSKALFEVFLNPTFHFLTQNGEFYPQSTTFYENLIEKAELAFALEYDELLIGSVILQKEANSFRLSYLYVQREFRGNSYAKMLVKEILNQSKGKEIFAYTLSGQREHERLFSEIGFLKTDETEQAEFEEGEYIFHTWLRS